MQSSDKKRRSGKGKIILLLILVLAVGAAAGILLYRHYDRKNDAVSGIQLDTNATDLDSSSSESVIDMIKFPGYGEITVSAGATEIPIVLTNPEGNPCYFKFHVYLKENGNDLYTSEQVTPGSAIRGITFEEPLETGDYTLEIEISTASLKDGSTMNGSTVEVPLHVTDEAS